MANRCSAIATAIVCCLSIALNAQSGVSYVYDDLGRLIGVIDGSGNSAVYHYDAVGNLTSIDRYTASQVAVFAFSPRQGPIATTVTIRGSGFSGTANQNTVTFNGTAATVSSATTSQLVVTVPTGATTGSIGVTTPNGSASSATSFSVTTGTSAPVITSFSPAIGVSGTSVTITGTGFDPTLLNDRVALNISSASPASAISTQIGLTVPAAATSGKVTVVTPLGTAVSSDDLFVAPSPYSAANVLLTGRLSLGTAKPLAMGTAGKIALELFDLPAGHRASLVVTNCSILSGSISVRNPYGATLGSGAVGVTGGFIEPFSASTTGGAYTVLLAPGGSYTGNATVTVYDVPADVTGSILPGAANAVTVAIGTPGQNARLTFQGTAGQRVSLKMSPGPIGGVSVRKPDGSELASGSVGAVTSFIDTQVLPATGTYAIAVDPLGTATGNVTLTLYDVPADLTGTISTGTPLTVNLDTPGRNGSWTFSGTAGQRVSLAIDGSAVSGSVAIRDSSNTILGSGSSGVIAAFIEPVVLAATGTYTVTVDPTTYNTGSATLTLYNVLADTTGSVTVNSSGVPLNLSTAGQNGTLTFSGTSGQQITVHAASNSIVGVTVKLLKPDGSQLTSTTSTAVSFNLATQTLPSTGTYTIVIDPSTTKTGNITISVSNP
jgi:YD repeat-containing protein